MATDATSQWWRAVTAARLAAALATGLALALALTLMLPAPTAEAATGCSVKTKATGSTYGTLQRAVDAARPRQTLLVRGTCEGPVVIRKSLSIAGVTTRAGRPRLVDGAPMLVVQRGHTVYLRNLKFRPRGLKRDPDSLQVGGRAIFNRGTLVATDILVVGGRGIRNSGRLTLLGDSRVRYTYGGVVNVGRLVLGGTTSIRKNFYYPLSVSVRNRGTVVMSGRSNIGYNGSQPGTGSTGGGIANRGRWVMNHRSSLHGQERDSAITNHGTLVMNGRASIHDNHEGGAYLGGPGRGAGVENHGRLVMNDHSSIHSNCVYASHDLDSGQGGGVYNHGTVTMRGSSVIRDNGPCTGWYEEHADDPVQGGGLFSAKAGTVAGVRCGAGGNVNGNTPDDCYFAD